MFIILVLLALTHNVAGEECEPGFADTCFSAVIEDLQYMINLKKMKEVNVTSYTVTELCLAVEDSLNCTSDVIDTDCTEHDGRYIFDSWLTAFRSAYRYVCDGPDHKGITDILHGVSCWSIEDFVLCVQEKAGLTDFRHILHMEMDDTECMDLHRAMAKCKASATVGSCREQDSVLEAVDGMIGAFFDGSDCGVHISIALNNSNGKALFSVIGIVLQLMLLSFVL